MNNIFTKEQLVGWIEDVIGEAANDTAFSISWFEGTKNSPLSIIAGWQECFSSTNDPDLSDCFCISTADPRYVMCIKIAVNEGPYAYTDFEIMNMPTDEDGEVDDVHLMLEWADDPEDLADFLMYEWERLMEYRGEEV